jgi:hypothetical protein
MARRAAIAALPVLVAVIRGNASTKRFWASLLSATAIDRMAVVSGVTEVPDAGIAGVALTGFDGDKAVAAMGKTLELDGGKRVLRQ